MTGGTGLTVDAGVPSDGTSDGRLDLLSQKIQTRPRSWRLIPEIDKDPRLIAIAQTLAGRILLLVAFALLLQRLGHDAFVITAAIAACAYAGRYRRYVIPIATLAMLYRRGFLVDASVVARVADQEGLAAQIDAQVMIYGMTAVTILLCGGAVHFRDRIAAALPVARRSTLCLILCFLGVVLVAQSPIATGMPRVLLWSFLLTFLPYLWFLAYALAEATGRDPLPSWQRLSVFQAFWNSSLTPFGKGLAYLRKFEARTSDDLAITQLKGLKLGIWIGLVSVGLNVFVQAIHGNLGVPQFDDTFDAFLSGTGYPRVLCWLSLLASFVEDVLNMTIWGGVIVACARMAGFRLLRNTYKPLAARTIAEFWNRYYFYYKELLVDHFFYPTFFRCFREHRRLRLLFATFVAACLGNFIYHFMRDIHFAAELGFWRALIGEQSHAFYTFLLATGIGISQIRKPVVNVSGGWLQTRALPCLWVVFFFCVLHVFDAPLDRDHSVWQRGQFLLHLFGVDAWI